jgi:hypothetical protein
VSSEVGAVIFLPALLGVAIVGGLAYAAGSAADAVAERQRRRIDAAARLSRAQADYAALQRRVAAARDQYGDRINAIIPPPEAQLATKNPAHVQQAVAALSAATESGEQQLRQQMATARTASLLESLLKSMPSAAPSCERASPGSPRPNDSSRQRLAVVAESVTRILGRLETAVPAATAQEFDMRAGQILAVASPVRAELLLDDLRVLVQRANERVAARRKQLDALHARLSGYAGESIDAARALLHSAADDPDPDWPGLARAVDEAIEQTVAAALNDYAVRALHESLAEVGCEVEEEFDTVLVRDGMAHVRRPGWNDLAVRVRLRPEDQALHFNVVRPRDTAAELDPAAESDWCTAFDALLPALARKGVELRVNMRAEIGSGRVQQVDPLRYPFQRRQQSQRRADDWQARERGRP